MIIKPYSVTLKDGKIYTVRSATGRDGPLMNAFRRQLASETDYLLRYPDEVPLSADGESKRLDAWANDRKDVFLLLMNGSEPVGSMHVYPESGFEKMSHRAEIGVQVAKKYWSIGAGTFLMTEGIRYAREAGFEILELFALDANERALGLYKRLGFVGFSRLPDGIRFRDGSSCDEVGMCLKLKR